ncbi:hypothetical protein CTJ03_13030, partial [Staphylococcus epidermidis]
VLLAEERGDDARTLPKAETQEDEAQHDVGRGSLASAGQKQRAQNSEGADRQGTQHQQAAAADLVGDVARGHDRHDPRDGTPDQRIEHRLGGIVRIEEHPGQREDRDHVEHRKAGQGHEDDQDHAFAVLLQRRADTRGAQFAGVQ